MRFLEFQINEGMSFHAYKKDPQKGYWMMVTGDESQYQDDVYKHDFKGDHKDHVNPKYKEEHDLHLSNMSWYDIFDVIGYDVDDNIPISEFIARTTQWLQKNLGKPSKEVPDQVDQNPGGPTMIGGGKPEGYYNRVIKQMNQIARDGQAMGATHVGAN